MALIDTGENPLQSSSFWKQLIFHVSALSVQEKQLIKSRLFLNLTELPQPVISDSANSDPL